MRPFGRSRADDGGRDWLTRVLSVLAVVGLGVLVGYQYLQPDKRVLAVSAAVVVFGVAWRMNLVSGIGVLLLALPFPRGTVFGSTNLAFILLLLVIWLLRYTQRAAPGPRRTPLDAPLATMMICGVLSFYNVDTARHLGLGLGLFALFVATILMYYLITSNVRSEADLKRLINFQVVSIGIVYLFCLWELAFPAHELIPGWIDLRTFNATGALENQYRVGGPWVDYEQLSEFAAMNIPFFVVLIAQTRSMTRRVIFAIFLLGSLVILFATATRGGITALALGLVYLLFLIRRRIQIVLLSIIAGAASMVVTAVYFVVTKNTESADILARFGTTHFVGWMPDTRAQVWPQAWERMMEHPILGHGPFYAAAEQGLKVWSWPHDLYLYVANCYGLVGLAAFLWILWTLWKMSTPRTDRLTDPDFAKAFQMVTRVQLAIFLVDEVKIEYLRNWTYQFEVWVFFSLLAATSMLVSRERAESPAPAARPAARVPLPARA